MLRQPKAGQLLTIICYNHWNWVGKYCQSEIYLFLLEWMEENIWFNILYKSPWQWRKTLQIRTRLNVGWKQEQSATKSIDNLHPSKSVIDAIGDNLKSCKMLSWSELQLTAQRREGDLWFRRWIAGTMFSVTAVSRGVDGTSRDYTVPGEGPYRSDPTGAFSLLKGPASSFTVKNLLRHYARWALD